MLTVDDLTVRLGGKILVKDVSFQLADGQWLMLCGPNGAGKSTLVEAVSRAISSTGTIALDGQDVRRMKPVQLARRVGVLSQHASVAYAFTVEQVVALGRYAYGSGVMGRGDAEGEARVTEALRAVEMEDKRDRSMLTLSGGERQRAFLAQVICQDPSVLILDEPANHLDLSHQRRLFELIDQWRRKPGRAVLSVVHDLSLARRFGTHALLLDGGHCVAQGDCASTLTRENLSRVWQMDVRGWMQELNDAWSDEDVLPRASRA